MSGVLVLIEPGLLSLSAQCTGLLALNKLLGKKREIARTEYKRYVTHVFYLEGPGTPAVDRADLSALGIESSKISGRNTSDGKRLYDLVALSEALSVQVSGPGASRRNTLTE